MKHILTACLLSLLLTACNRDNDERPVCRLSDNYQYGYYVQLPTAFTPNGDGKNDVFRPLIYSGAQLASYHMTITDKSGNTLFESTDTARGWDGRDASGAIVPGRYAGTITYYSGYGYGGSASYSFCLALLNKGSNGCIPRSADGEYIFADMWQQNNGFQNPTAESICN